MRCVLWLKPGGVHVYYKFNGIKGFRFWVVPGDDRKLPRKIVIAESGVDTIGPFLNLTPATMLTTKLTEMTLSDKPLRIYGEGNQNALRAISLLSECELPNSLTRELVLDAMIYGAPGEWLKEHAQMVYLFHHKLRRDCWKEQTGGKYSKSITEEP